MVICEGVMVICEGVMVEEGERADLCPVGGMK